MKNIKKIAKELVNLNIKEINELSNILEKDYNIKFNNNLMQNNIIPKDKNDNNNNNNLNNNINQDKNIPSIVDIYLKSVGTVKLPVIKLLKNITGLSLTESKKIIDNIPSLIKKSLKIEEAKKIQEDFKKIDAVIEIK
ncbi:MAG: ribosomal protein L7/L12 [Candidatus Shikimatogenerans bostrichidophilus]|nr:MAG: ribosomal protein L7/L12 [Candidatus Shikimatogenerans bostrichidophilus]